MTWKMAPAPIDRKITAKIGENANPPTHEPKIAGTPANRPNATNFPTIFLSLDSGAAIARPSVVLCKVKPTIRNVLKAMEPSPMDAPIASPSPKLCNPIPIEIINPIAMGLDIFNASALLVNFSAG